MIAGRSQPGGSFGIVQPSLKRVSVLEFMDAGARHDYRKAIKDASDSLPDCTIILNQVCTDLSYRLEAMPDECERKTKHPGVSWHLVCETVLPPGANEDDLAQFDGVFKRLEERHAAASFRVLLNEIAIRQFDPQRKRPAIKRFGFIQRRPDLTSETLCHAWREDHAPVFALDGLIRRYSVHLTDRILDAEAEWDGFAELWWDQVSHIEAGQPEALDPALLHKARSNARRSLYLFLEELEVFEPHVPG